jgi:hypothetical protein
VVGILIPGSRGFLRALVVSVVLLVGGSLVVVRGARTAGVVLVAVVVPVDLVLGVPRRLVSTAISGLPGLLAGKSHLFHLIGSLTDCNRGPFSSWTGTWSGCSSTTDEPVPATVTTTVNGQVVTGTTFGIQAVESGSGAGSIAVHVSTARGIGAFAAVAAGIFGAMIAL